MKRIIKISTSTIIALLICTVIYSVVLASTDYVSEQGGGFSESGLSSATGCSSSTCLDTNAKFTNQSTNGSVTAYGKWNTETDNVSQWYTFIPNLSGDWAAVKYEIKNSPSEDYFTTVNQNNWKGSYVNLGTYSLSSTWSQIYLPNTCVTGYSCDGRRLYFDKSKYNY